MQSYRLENLLSEDKASSLALNDIIRKCIRGENIVSQYLLHKGFKLFLPAHTVESYIVGLTFSIKPQNSRSVVYRISDEKRFSSHTLPLHAT